MKIPRKLVIPIYVAMVAALATLVGFIAYWLGAYNPQMWGFFTLIGIILVAILYVFGRQIYWAITKTGDYENKNQKG